MRYAFVKQLTKIAYRHKDVILLTGDLGFNLFEGFAKKYPAQFFNVGVAENNMIGLAAGLAFSGKTVFAYSIASFATFKPYEFIRSDVCLHNLPVIIVGSGGGLSYADNGPTHVATHDIALMRTLPNMTVLCPADPFEANWATEEALKLKSPVYLRLGKKGEPDLYNHPNKLKIGQGRLIKSGKDYVIIATGNIVFNALCAAKILEKSGISGAVISMHTVKPIDRKLIETLAQKYANIITVEEHSVIGGLGSAVAEILAQISNSDTKLLILGVPDKFPEKNGSQNYFRERFGLNPEKISLKIKNLLNND